MCQGTWSSSHTVSGGWEITFCLVRKSGIVKGRRELCCNRIRDSGRCMGCKLFSSSDLCQGGDRHQVQVPSMHGGGAKSMAVELETLM